MTTKDFKGRCYMRGHPRICLNMLGTHLMAVPDICGKKKRHHAFCGLTFWELTFWDEPVTQLKQLKACKCKNDASAKLHSNSSHFHYMKPAVGKQLNWSSAGPHKAFCAYRGFKRFGRIEPPQTCVTLNNKTEWQWLKGYWILAKCVPSNFANKLWQTWRKLKTSSCDPGAMLEK